MPALTGFVAAKQKAAPVAEGRFCKEAGSPRPAANVKDGAHGVSRPTHPFTPARLSAPSRWARPGRRRTPAPSIQNHRAGRRCGDVCGRFYQPIPEDLGKNPLFCGFLPMPSRFAVVKSHFALPLFHFHCCKIVLHWRFLILHYRKIILHCRFFILHCCKIVLHRHFSFCAAGKSFCTGAN